MYYIVLEWWLVQNKFDSTRKDKSKTEKGASEPNARLFMPRGGSLSGGTVLESDSPKCPTLESERG